MDRIQRLVISEVSEEADINIEEVSLLNTFKELGIDSLGITSITGIIENKYDIYIHQTTLSKVTIVNDLVESIKKEINKK